MYNSKYFKAILLSLSMVIAVTAKANGPVRENVGGGPEEPAVEADSPQASCPDCSVAAETSPGILNIKFDLGDVKSSTPASDAVRNSVRDYLREHPDCAEQKYRYCEVYLPTESPSGNVECEDGYTFYSNDVIGLNIQRRGSPPVPEAMKPGPRNASLDQLVKRGRGAHATLIGVCRRI